jgi:hypothetical protein
VAHARAAHDVDEGGLLDLRLFRRGRQEKRRVDSGQGSRDRRGIVEVTGHELGTGQCLDLLGRLR